MLVMIEERCCGSWPLFLGLTLALYAIMLIGFPSDSMNIPTVKYSSFLPEFINRMLYYVFGKKLIQQGYKKVCLQQQQHCTETLTSMIKYNNVPFRVLKADGDLIVLPARYIEELRNHPPAVLSSLDAQSNNIVGEYTKVLTESYLPSYTVTKRLNPAIGRIIPILMQELSVCFKTEIPKCEDEWVPVNIFDMMLSMLSRSTSRIIAGDALCRNDQWLKLMADYTNNVGLTLILLRPLPKMVRPLVAWMLPSVRNLNKQMAFAKNELFIPLINGRRHSERYDPQYEKPDDYLQWMMDIADNPRDADPEFMAHNLFVIMSLAFVHTSTMLMTHMVFDLIDMPQYLEPLREEVRETFKFGWVNATQASFIHQHRMDSFMKEVQRFNPVAEVSMHRIVRQPITLSDGLVLPKGIHICFPAGPLTRDPEIVPQPLPFDGLRWAQSPECKSNSFVSIGPANMHFGFGRQACPGRFFAASSIKAVMSRLIMEYDFKFRDGQSRPENINNGEQTMPNMFARVLIRKRKGVTV